MTAAISAKGLTKRFKTGRTFVAVLRDVDFEAEAGHVTMVMGPSGSGKSTLIAALSGLLKPDEGKVCVLGEDLWSRRPPRIAKRRSLSLPDGRRRLPARRERLQPRTVDARRRPGRHSDAYAEPRLSAGRAGRPGRHHLRLGLRDTSSREVAHG